MDTLESYLKYQSGEVKYIDTLKSNVASSIKDIESEFETHLKSVSKEVDTTVSSHNKDLDEANDRNEHQVDALDLSIDTSYSISTDDTEKIIDEINIAFDANEIAKDFLIFILQREIQAFDTQEGIAKAMAQEFGIPEDLFWEKQKKLYLEGLIDTDLELDKISGTSSIIHDAIYEKRNLIDRSPEVSSIILKDLYHFIVKYNLISDSNEDVDIQRFLKMINTAKTCETANKVLQPILAENMDKVGSFIISHFDLNSIVSNDLKDLNNDVLNYLRESPENRNNVLNKCFNNIYYLNQSITGKDEYEIKKRCLENTLKYFLKFEIELPDIGNDNEFKNLLHKVKLNNSDKIISDIEKAQLNAKIAKTITPIIADAMTNQENNPDLNSGTSFKI